MDKITPFAFKEALENLKSFNMLIAIISFAIGITLLPILNTHIKIAVNFLYISLGFLVLGLIVSKGIKWRVVLFPIGCICVVIILAFISLWYSVDIANSKYAIKKFLFESSLFMLVAYFLVSNSTQKSLQFFYILLVVGIFLNPIASIYDFFIHHHSRATGFGYQDIIVYGLWIIIPLAISIAYVFLYPKSILAYISLAISILAMYANGTRGVYIAFISMIFIAFIVKSIKTLRGFLIWFLLCCMIIFSYYQYSKTLTPRYNLAVMLNNFSTIWNLSAAQMGRFDRLCFNGTFLCSVYSGNQLDDSIIIDDSALARISMAKSIITAQKPNPFIPQGFGYLMFDRTINHIFNDSLENPSKDVPYPRMFNPRNFINTYQQFNQPHNHVLSIYLELGILGVLSIGAFLLYVMIMCIKSLKKSNLKNQHIIDFFGVLFVVGLSASAFFHNYYTRESILMIFALFGILLGQLSRSQNA